MQRAIDDILGHVPGVSWAIRIVGDGGVLADVTSSTPMPTASIGKVFLLAEVARRIADGSLDPFERLRPQPDDFVSDSGLWQHLGEPDLRVASLAVLVASVSDNIAANVLLRRVGLSSVQSVSTELGMPQTAMLDRIRDTRGPHDPAMPSQGRADDLARLMRLIAQGEALGPIVSGTLAGWLSLNTDLSMVASAFALDPLAHAAGDGGVPLFNKTGTDRGVLADTGHLVGPLGGVSYAAIARWDPMELDRTAPVRRAMRDIGDAVVRAAGH